MSTLKTGPYLGFEPNFHFSSALFWALGTCLGETMSGSKAVRHFELLSCLCSWSLGAEAGRSQAL